MLAAESHRLCKWIIFIIIINCIYCMLFSFVMFKHTIMNPKHEAPERW